MSMFLTAMQREPIVMWSLFIGGLGIAMPLVVPPIREYLEPPKTVAMNPNAVAIALAMNQK